ncbi:hypothetical protein [Myroides marinus]|uniref:hypothetical protein n=1 Tax=Myroides marinus TaxID=703342 RepID=UPI002578973E|nr:hypothetical protein [Myroides marinus]MDM1362292.1 hypothetical protein [Myroides marinus]
MKKVMFFVGCVFASLQTYAQESLRMNFDLQAGTSYEVSITGKNSTTSNLMGNPEMIEKMKKEGGVYPRYETTDMNGQYIVHWKDGGKKKSNFQLDLVNSTSRSFEGSKQKDVEKIDALQNVATGVAERRGVKYTEVLNEQFKPSSKEVIEALNELFFNGFGNTALKVNEVYKGNSKKKIALSDENVVEVSTLEEMKLYKIVDGKAYFTIDSKISSASKSTKYSEMNGIGKKEVVYNIEKGFIESMEDTIDITVNMATEENLTINMINKVYQKLESKKK